MKTTTLAQRPLGYLACAVLALSPLSVSASSWFVSPQVSTVGISAQVGYRTDHDFSVRAAWNEFGFDKRIRINQVKYDADIKLRSLGFMVDYYPMNNGFHVTAGLYKNDNGARASGPIDATFTVPAGTRGIRVDGKTLGDFHTRVKYAPIAPYLGLGYHNVTKQGFSFTFDLGVLYQGSARVSVDPPASLANINHPSVKAAIDRQKRAVQDKADEARWYPVISLGVAYTF